MRELTTVEVDDVSGAGLMDALYSGILLGATAGAAGAIIGGKHGGDGGGLLGVGSIGQGVGMIVAGAIGVAAGSVAGGLYGFNHRDQVEKISMDFYKSVVNGTF
ncbi:colicin V synthesis protein [Erwinia sp. SLM-02]|uniref:colicin V synthesis protein n=1 Tax=Erwinia sp. SLM-02 TaxID=3020057 RepID=UPI003080BE95